METQSSERLDLHVCRAAPCTLIDPFHHCFPQRMTKSAYMSHLQCIPGRRIMAAGMQPLIHKYDLPGLPTLLGFKVQLLARTPLRKTPQPQHRSSSQNHAARLIPGAARELQLQLIPVLCMLGSQSTREHSCCDRSGMISLRIDRCFSPSGRDDSQCCPAAACLLPLFLTGNGRLSLPCTLAVGPSNCPVAFMYLGHRQVISSTQWAGNSRQGLNKNKKSDKE